MNYTDHESLVTKRSKLEVLFWMSYEKCEDISTQKLNRKRGKTHVCSPRELLSNMNCMLQLNPSQVRYIPPPELHRMEFSIWIYSPKSYNFFQVWPF
jgi:hypothetical protein